MKHGNDGNVAHTQRNARREYPAGTAVYDPAVSRGQRVQSVSAVREKASMYRFRDGGAACFFVRD